MRVRLDDLRTSLDRSVATQLGRPQGLAGRLVGAVLNRANGSLIAQAVDALDLGDGATAADIGFGGGAGLRLLLDRVGPTGKVHGVEVSTEMLERAAHRFRDDCRRGTVTFHEAAMDSLPIEEGAVDGLITLNTIYFIEDLVAAFTDVARVMAPGGRFVVGVRDPEAMEKSRVTAHGFRIRSIPEVVATAEAAGLRLVESRALERGPMPGHLLVLGEA